MKVKPAFIIAATKSGSGKTTLTLGIVAALVRRGLRVQCFKCGPDFIDPTLHLLVSSKKSYNLDLKMMGVDCCRQTFVEQSQAADVVVVEGVMGLFDGGDASTAALAKALDLPVLLVVDAGSAAESCAALVHGFQSFDPALKVCGVVFNRIGSPRHRQLIDEAMRQHSSIDYRGYFGRDNSFRIPDRHLGLHMGTEEPLSSEGLSNLIKAVEQDLDIDRIIDLASTQIEEPPRWGLTQELENTITTRRKFRLGVALDEAFCFYYPQNLELFEQKGFEIVHFSPIHEEKLPADLDMLYFGGGYPENFASELSQNRQIRNQLLEVHRQNLPIYAECGGFMFLCQSLTDMEGEFHPMTGIFPFDTVMNKRLRRLGYRQVRLRANCLLGSRGDLLHGHEFHYSEINQDSIAPESDNEYRHLYCIDNNSQEGYSVGSALGSYVHLHLGNTVSVIENIYQQVAERHKQNNDHY